jgi:cobalt-zinc-cadmium efflux system protein
MSSGHRHRGGAGRRHIRPLAISFGLVVVFMVVEAVTAFLTGSLALLSDAGHMATDALGLGMALAAILAASRASGGSNQTYGMYRLEIFAALGNAVLLLAVAGYVIWEAIHRFSGAPEILTTPMLVVALVGLIVNLVGWRLLRQGAEESINVKGAYFEVVADMAGSIGVIVAALVTIFTGWPYADPLVAMVIGLWIVPRAFRLAGQAFRVLSQAAPEHLDLQEVERWLGAVNGVIDVHDLHVWTLTSEMEVATVHLRVADDADSHRVLDEARELLETRFHIEHATLQVEPDSHRECIESNW